jgi:hypothetical protein
MWHVLGEVHARFWCGYLKELGNLEDLGQMGA